MSTNAYWRIKQPKKGHSLSDKVKRLFARRYMDHDGSLSGKATIRRDDYEWLTGLYDGGTGEVLPILEELDKGNEVEIWLEC